MATASAVINKRVRCLPLSLLCWFIQDSPVDHEGTVLVYLGGRRKRLEIEYSANFIIVAPRLKLAHISGKIKVFLPRPVPPFWDRFAPGSVFEEIGESLDAGVHHKRKRQWPYVVKETNKRNIARTAVHSRPLIATKKPLALGCKRPEAL
jgi:hypothetical protein